MYLINFQGNAATGITSKSADEEHDKTEVSKIKSSEKDLTVTLQQ